MGTDFIRWSHSGGGDEEAAVTATVDADDDAMVDMVALVRPRRATANEAIIGLLLLLDVVLPSVVVELEWWLSRQMPTSLREAKPRKVRR